MTGESHHAGGTEQEVRADGQAGVGSPRNGRNRIARVMVSCLVMFYVFLTIICVITYHGFNGLLENADLIADEQMPRLRDGMRLNREMSSLLLSLEGVLSTDARNIRKSDYQLRGQAVRELAASLSGEADAQKAGISAGLLRISLMLERLDGFVVTSGQIEQSFFSRLDAVSQILLPLIELRESGNAEKKNEELAAAALRLWNFLISCR
ncbi:MAG: hypothetical protein LBB52_05630, partial [Desulfovibrio sp.]|nr:hypothetical protein [Desulfovibrio sp.]